ncbi:MAG: hypothetical protein EXQ69_07970 [Acidimicrobiia bacterium]|nr:hypothetical protein [Acidimicrobiia bacterium]
MKPVEARRAQISKGVVLAKRTGYTALLISIAVFAFGALSGFPQWTVVVVMGCLVIATVVLPIPIVLGYGIRAAEREEQGGKPFH